MFSYCWFLFQRTFISEGLDSLRAPRGGQVLFWGKDKVTHPQPLAQPCVPTGLIQVPLTPLSSRRATPAPVRGSLPSLPGRVRLHDWSCHGCLGARRMQEQGPFSLNSQAENPKWCLLQQLCRRDRKKKK